MDTYEKANALRFRALLLERARQLAEILSPASALAGDHAAEVADFKDVAARDAMAGVDEVQATHAAEELQGVQDALQRIEDGSFGTCLDCGDAILERRLLAMPTARYCTSCQAAHERGAAAHS